MSKRILWTVLSLALLAAGAAVAAEKTDDGIQWYSYEEGLAAAKEKGLPIVIDFHADWCKWCKEMDKTTFRDADVVARMNGRFIPISVDTQKEKAVAAKYGVQSLPSMWFLESSGERIDVLPGYQKADFFTIVLDYVASGSYKSVDFGVYYEERS